MKKILFINLIFIISLFGNVKLADDIGFIDEISINGREFESLEQRTIEFYPEDLKDGKVIVEGILESLNEKESVENLFVEISLDGGEKWNRTKGQEDWVYSFIPEFGKIYEFSIRIVKEIKDNNIILKKQNPQQETLPNDLSIGGFALSLSEESNIQDNILSGSGNLIIPFLENLQLDNLINVDFNDLRIEDNNIVVGQIIYDEPITIDSFVATINIQRIVFDPNPRNNRIEGTVQLKGFLREIEAIGFSNNTVFLPESFSLDLSLDNKLINIWEEKGTKVVFESGKAIISYNTVQNQPDLRFENLNAFVDFGRVFSSGDASLKGRFTNSPDGQLQGNYELRVKSTGVRFPRTGIVLNSMVVNFDLSNIYDPIIRVRSDVNFRGHNNNLIRSLNQGTLEAAISRRGMEGIVQVDHNFEPVTILDRGSSGNNVKFVIPRSAETELSFSLTENSDIPQFNLNGLSAQIHFGDILQTTNNENDTLVPVVGELFFEDNQADQLSLRFVNYQRGYLLGQRLGLDSINADFDLNNQTIRFNGSVNTQEYDNPFIQSLTGSLFNGEVSPAGFSGSIEIDGGLNPVTLIDRGGRGRDVVLSTEGNPIVDLEINNNDIDFNFSNLDAIINFGDVLQTRPLGNSPLVVRVTKRDGRWKAIRPPNTNVYLLGQNFGLDNFNMGVDIENKLIDIRAIINTQNSENYLHRAVNGSEIALQLNPEGISGTITSDGRLEPITILDRGSKQKNVEVRFSQDSKVTLSIVRNEIDISLKSGNPSISFGDLFDNEYVQVTQEKENNQNVKGFYNWRIRGYKKLVKGKNIYLTQIRGKLDIRDLNDPIITFDSMVDLRRFNSAFSEVGNVELREARITREGLFVDLEVQIERIDIWREKRVKVEFNENPQVSIFVTRDNAGIGMSHVNMDLHFGELLENTIIPIRQHRDGDLNVENQMVYYWEINDPKRVANTQVILNRTSGVIDLRDMNNPFIRFDALMDIRRVSPLFHDTNPISIDDALVNKDGLDAAFSTQLEELDIWPEKNVALIFNDDAPQRFFLNINNDGLNIGLSNLNSTLDLGDLMDVRVRLVSQNNGKYSWRVNDEKRLGNSQIRFRNMDGEVDLEDVTSPKVKFNSRVNLSEYGGPLGEFRSIAFTDGVITSDGFRGDISAQIDEIDIWREKEVKIQFPEGETPVIKLVMTREDVQVGIRNINANLNFGELLDGQVVPLRPQECSFDWALNNNYNLIRDNNGVVTVSRVEGTTNLCDLSNPFLIFDADANFSNYNFNNIELNQVNLEDTKISKNGIDWNLNIQNAATEYTILDLGSRDEDVRVELFNIGARANNAGGNVQNVDGKLYFGALFEGEIRPVDLHYDDRGYYTFETNQIITYRGNNGDSIEFRNVNGKVRRVGENYNVSLGGSTRINTPLLSHFGLDSIDVENLVINRNGMSGNIIGDFVDNHSVDILNEKVSIQLRTINLGFDSTRDIPISINNIDGDLNFKNIFDNQNRRARLEYRDNKFYWSMNEQLFYKEGKFLFRNLEGELDLNEDNLRVAFSGMFAYEGLDLFVDIDNFYISERGLGGSISLNNIQESVPGIDNLRLSSLAISFTDENNIGGSVSLNYNESNFLGTNQNFDITLNASFTSRGVSNYSIDHNGGFNTIEIQNFATMGFTRVAVNPDFNDFYIDLDGHITPNNSLLSADNRLDLEGIRISSNGVTIQGGRVEFDVGGSAGSLGGIALSIDSMAIGLNNDRFYLDTSGDLSLVIAEAGANVRLYSNGDLEVDRINMAVNTPALTMVADVEWYSNDPTFGNGFSVDPAAIRLVNMFNVEGVFKIGKHRQKGFYWMAKAQGGLGAAGVSMGPINMYSLGGGVAKNMSFDKESESFTPSGNYNQVIILSSLLGTPDSGFTWHGDVDLNIDLDGQIVIEGDTYILSPLNDTPDDKRVSGRIVFGMSPFSLHITADANIDYSVISVNGSTDILFNNNEKHVFIGTDDRAEGFNVPTPLGPVEVSILGFGANGYFMIDTRRLAFGMGYEIDKTWKADIWGPDPWVRVNAGARADALVVYNPFQMKVGGNAHVDISAGYLFLNTTIGAGMAFELAAPDPNYLWGKVRVNIFDLGNLSFSGYVYGGGRSSSRNQDIVMPSIEFISPLNNQQDTSLYPRIIIETPHTFRESVRDGNVTLGEVTLSKERDVINLRELINEREEDKLVFVPVDPLEPNTNYTISVTPRYLDRRSARIYDGLIYIQGFRTTNRLEFDDVFDRITPENNRVNVNENENILIKYKQSINIYGHDNPMIRNYQIVVKDGKNEVVQGRFETIGAASAFYPSEPMRIYHFCVNDDTGEVRETIKNAQGQYLNPFNFYQVDGPREDNDNEIFRNGSNRPNGLKSGNVQNARLDHFSQRSSDGNYSYYTTDTYSISVKDRQKNQVVYYSEFKIASNEQNSEDFRAFQALGRYIEPTLTYRELIAFDGARSTQDEDGCISKVKFEIDPNYDDIGMSGSEGHPIIYMDRVTMLIKTSNGNIVSRDKRSAEMIPEIAVNEKFCGFDSAQLIYYNRFNPVGWRTPLQEKDLRIVQGVPEPVEVDWDREVNRDDLIQNRDDNRMNNPQQRAQMPIQMNQNLQNGNQNQDVRRQNDNNQSLDAIRNSAPEVNRPIRNKK